MNFIFKITRRVMLFGILTILTQIGGIVYLISLLVNRKCVTHLKLKKTITFLSIYLFCTYLIVPLLAPNFGRERVKHTELIKPTNYMTVLLNRNYVRPGLNRLLQQTAQELKNTRIEIHYLDANFPFLNKFPLLPHLSHNDGKKIDISLIYETSNGVLSTKQKSISGYGAFENPKSNEFNQIAKCINQGHIQYDYPKFLTLGSINSALVFSNTGTKKLIQSLLKDKSLGKLFIEPHLKQRLKLNNPKVRYHGCRAVRHDDHIHIQLK